MMKHSIVVFAAVAAMLQTSSAQSPTVSPQLIIPDEAAAIRVAEAVLTSKFDAKTMEAERPYKANLSDGVWRVWGTVPKDALGLAAFVDIDQKARLYFASGSALVCKQII